MSQPYTACSGRWGFGRDFGDFCPGVEFWRDGFPVRPTAAYASRWADTQSYYEKIEK
jgi:hypothetical protein